MCAYKKTTIKEGRLFKFNYKTITSDSDRSAGQQVRRGRDATGITKELEIIYKFETEQRVRKRRK